jgi:SAM-dependent methyltransferase
MAQQASNPVESYHNFLGPALFAPWAKLLIERAAPGPGEQVLDLACGTGIVTRQVAPLVGETGKVVGVDISPDMLAVARGSVGKDDGARGRSCDPRAGARRRRAVRTAPVGAA